MTGGKTRTDAQVRELMLKSITIDKNGCWLWQRSLSAWGYGQQRYHNYPTYAHRLAWKLFHGPIPPGLWVLHRCDIPRCINIAHLFLGTARSNVRDMCRKGRARGRLSR